MFADPGESSIFSSAPLGFYILGSMLMLVGAKFLAGWCFLLLSAFKCLMLTSLFVNCPTSLRSPLTLGRLEQEHGNEPISKGIPGPSSWKVLEKQDMKFFSFFFYLNICDFFF